MSSKSAATTTTRRNLQGNAKQEKTDKKPMSENRSNNRQVHDVSSPSSSPSYNTFKFRLITWNQQSKGSYPSPQELREKLFSSTTNNKNNDNSIDYCYDVIAIGTQECGDVLQSLLFPPNFYKSPKQQKWENLLHETLAVQSNYTKIHCHSMVAIHFVLYVRNSILPNISYGGAYEVPTGTILGLGNKGGIAICLNIAQQSFLFMTCHLAAFQNKMLERRDEFLFISHEMTNALSFKKIRRSILLDQDTTAYNDNNGGGDRNSAADGRRNIFVRDEEWDDDDETNSLGRNSILLSATQSNTSFWTTSFGHNSILLSSQGNSNYLMRTIRQQQYSGFFQLFGSCCRGYCPPLCQCQCCCTSQCRRRGGTSSSPSQRRGGYSIISQQQQLNQPQQPQVITNGNPLSREFDHVFIMGDLNFRINSTRETVDEWLAASCHDLLLEQDQLTWLMSNGNDEECFDGLAEGPIQFPPTYKFDRNSDVYDTSSKRRIPAWTDRILYKPTKETELLHYGSIKNIKISDHRPVVADFAVKIMMTPAGSVNDTTTTTTSSTGTTTTKID